MGFLKKNHIRRDVQLTDSKWYSNSFEHWVLHLDLWQLPFQEIIVHDSLASHCCSFHHIHHRNMRLMPSQTLSNFWGILTAFKMRQIRLCSLLSLEDEVHEIIFGTDYLLTRQRRNTGKYKRRKLVSVPPIKSKVLLPVSDSMSIGRPKFIQQTQTRPLRM